jgi:aerobic-type carbon monoxide dehydrogenase small subunit (CoxS/CutS family)
METYNLTVNGQRRKVTADPSMPLLWVLREDLKMTGTKYGCGISACGACTVHLGGTAMRSCVLPVSRIGDRPITTIEGIGAIPSAAPCRTPGWTTMSSSAATARADRS